MRLCPKLNLRCSVYTDNAKLRRLKDADFALFTALWWPHTALKELRILSFLVIWLFTWDDEIDEPTGSCAQDFEGAQRLREETLQFVAWCLGLEKKERGIEPSNRIIESFRPIGQALSESYNLGQFCESRVSLTSSLTIGVRTAQTLLGRNGSLYEDVTARARNPFGRQSPHPGRILGLSTRD